MNGGEPSVVVAANVAHSPQSVASLCDDLDIDPLRARECLHYLRQYDSVNATAYCLVTHSALTTNSP